MIILIIGLLAAMGLAAYLGVQVRRLSQAADSAEARCRQMQKDRAIRQNLQHIVDSRDAEIRRLRTRLRQCEADAREMEDRASELNLSLFQESGRRIIAEREDGVKKVRMDLMQHELEDARQKLASAQEAAAQREAALQAIIEQRDATIAQQVQKIEKLSAAHARRAARRAQLDALPDQVTLDDLIGRGDDR